MTSLGESRGNPGRTRNVTAVVKLVPDPDADLVEACRHPDQDGFEAAFEQLFLRYRDRVYAIAYRVTCNSVDAMDVVQEAFSLVFRKLDSFRAGSLFSTWLFRLVVNCSIDHRRRSRSRGWQSREGIDYAVETVTDPGAAPDAAAEAREFGGHIQEAIGLLSPKLRVILALRYLEDMSYEELAATLELSLGTVKSRLARAHIALERVVRERFPHLENVAHAGKAYGGGA